MSSTEQLPAEEVNKVRETSTSNASINRYKKINGVKAKGLMDTGADRTITSEAMVEMLKVAIRGRGIPPAWDRRWPIDSRLDQQRDGGQCGAAAGLRRRHYRC